MRRGRGADLRSLRICALRHFVNEFADLCWTHQDEIIAALSHVSETTAGSDWQEAMAEIAGLRDRLGKAFAEITRLSSASATPATRAAGNTSRSYFEGYRPEPILGVNGWMTANAIEGYLGEREGQPGTTPMAIPFTLFEWRDILTALRAATDSRGQHG